jgi:hypothetical protein
MVYQYLLTIRLLSHAFFMYLLEGLSNHPKRMKLLKTITAIVIALVIIIAMILATKKSDKNLIYFRNAPPMRRRILVNGD